MDLRHLAIMLDEGSKKAHELEDAPLCAALSAMAEVAVNLYQGSNVWNVEEAFAELLERYL